MRHQKRPGKGPEQRTTFEENSEGKEGNKTETQLHRTELQEMEDGKKLINKNTRVDRDDNKKKVTKNIAQWLQRKSKEKEPPKRG